MLLSFKEVLWYWSQKVDVRVSAKIRGAKGESVVRSAVDEPIVEHDNGIFAEVTMPGSIFINFSSLIVISDKKKSETSQACSRHTTPPCFKD